jgi:hypothetical protein
MQHRDPASSRRPRSLPDNLDAVATALFLVAGVIGVSGMVRFGSIIHTWETPWWAFPALLAFVCEAVSKRLRRRSTSLSA